MKRHIPVLLLLVLGLAACTSQASSIIGTWKLVSYGPPDSMTAAVPDADVTLTFIDDGTLTGSGGCNSLGGSYETDGTSITFSNVVSTLMACDDARMIQESAVTQVLTGTATYQIGDQTLTIANNDIQVVFTAVPQK